ncbi:MAG: AAA family ATPase [Deltaproteobacteria bacterium]|nr:AAA family ATPase [Deltaproteobacteria bacterium]
MKDQSNHCASMSLSEASSISCGLLEKVSSVIFGQEELVTEALCTFLAGGHILMTGAPGLAKTTLVRVISRALGMHSGRIQFTPDLLPSDITGSEVLNIDGENGRRHFDFIRGPVFSNLLLADEINRASPRTQSAMLEAMQERQVTVGGKVYPLPEPFMVFATQNPFESEGTFPLPEAQLDRFLLHSIVDYPDKSAELAILKAHSSGQLAAAGSDHTVLDAETIRQLMLQTNAISCDESILELINDLIRSSRPEDESCPANLKPFIWYGAGPRAGISLISASRAFAMMSQDETVRWRHIRRMAVPVLRHRIRLTMDGVQDEYDEARLIMELIENLEQKHRPE